MSVNKKVSLVHHWMEFFRGGEAVLEQFGRLFPEAPVSILVYNEKNLTESLKKHAFRPSFLQKSALMRRHFRKLLPFFPEIIRTIKVPRESEFVLSTDAAMIKGVRIPEGVRHVCYCHSPPRYLWGMEDAYLDSSSHKNRLGRLLFSATMPRLRKFDWRMAQRVDGFIANSRCVQERILRCYGRASVVIHPPVSLERFCSTRMREDFYLVVSALVPYKFVNIAVDACTRLRRKLVVIGTGPEEADLKKRAGDCVMFLGWASNETVQDHYERCRAFLFPGVEDFGITPCEAQASGAPVIAFGEGGALETVCDGVSGLFFAQQSAESMIAAIQRFEGMRAFDPEACRNNVAHLGPERFRAEIRDYLSRAFPGQFANYLWPQGEPGSLMLSPTYKETFAAIAPHRDYVKGHRPTEENGLTALEVVEPGEGGGFRHVEALIHQLLERGVRVHLAYSDRRGSRSLVRLCEQIRASGGEVLNLRVINKPELVDFAAVWRLWRMICRLRPDVIHGHSSKAGVLVRAAGSFCGFGRAIIYTPHAYFGMANNSYQKRFLYNTVETVLARIGTTINISAAEANFGLNVLRVPAARQHIIANPVDTMRFRPPTEEQRQRARAKLGLSNGDIAVGYVARMCSQKDPETAYDAFLDVASRWPQAKLLHLGWGTWKDYLQGKASARGLQDRVRIFDYAEDPVEFYHGIDVLLISSIYEAGWPFVLMEALACELPVVAATCPGMQDVGQAELSHIYAFEPTNRIQCAAQLEKWLRARGEGNVPMNHRSYVETHFSPENSFGRVHALYRSQVAKKRGGSS